MNTFLFLVVILQLDFYVLFCSFYLLLFVDWYFLITGNTSSREFISWSKLMLWWSHWSCMVSYLSTTLQFFINTWFTHTICISTWWRYDCCWCTQWYVYCFLFFFFFGDWVFFWHMRKDTDFLFSCTIVVLFSIQVLKTRTVIISWMTRELM